MCLLCSEACIYFRSSLHPSKAHWASWWLLIGCLCPKLASDWLMSPLRRWGHFPGQVRGQDTRYIPSVHPARAHCPMMPSLWRSQFQVFPFSLRIYFIRTIRIQDEQDLKCNLNVGRYQIHTKCTPRHISYDFIWLWFHMIHITNQIPHRKGFEMYKYSIWIPANIVFSKRITNRKKRKLILENV